MFDFKDDSERKTAIEGIIDSEWQMFQEVNNIGGRASCQNDKNTFYIMRFSQFAAWNDQMIKSYAKDLATARADGRNLITEKYAFMMEKTDAQRFRSMQPLLHEPDSETMMMIYEIVDYMVECEREVKRKYPYVSAAGRPLDSTMDEGGFTSVETYAFGELKTYSKETIKLYLEFVRLNRANGINNAMRVLGATARFYGYESLEEAEAKLRGSATRTDTPRSGGVSAGAVADDHTEYITAEKLPTAEEFYLELDGIFAGLSIVEAEKYISSVLEMAKAAGDEQLVIAAANELGGVYRVTDRFDEGIAVYQENLNRVRRHGMAGTLNEGTILLNLASVYSEKGDYRKALEVYRQVEVIYSNNGISGDYRQAALLNNISHVYDALGNMEEAVKSAEQSLRIISDIPNARVELATTCTSLASRYLKQNRFEDCGRMLDRAENVFLSLPGRTDVHYSAVLNTRGELYFQQGRYAEAESEFTKALEQVTKNYGENAAAKKIRENIQKCKNIQINAAQTDYAEYAENTSETVYDKSDVWSNGMELCEKYFYAYGLPMLQRDFAEYLPYVACGLVGEGSECMGYDDEISRDHDFGPGFCIWLPAEVYAKVGAQMQMAYDRLPSEFAGIKRIESAEGGGRVGVFEIEGFYAKFLGRMPENNRDWLMLSESTLLTASDGKVFMDNFGDFSRKREVLKGFYPGDIMLKKLAARLAVAAQAGQYNYSRCMKRGDSAAAYMACGEFVKAAASAVYLLNGKYMPYYKWLIFAMKDLKILSEVSAMLKTLMLTPDTPENADAKTTQIENVCVSIRKELNRQNLSSIQDNFLHLHTAELMNRINDPQIKNLPAIFDVKQ